MTPRLAFSVAKKIKENEQKLVRVGFYCLLAVVLLGVLNAIFLDYLFPIVFLPLGVLFFICGLGVIGKWFEEGATFEEFWNNCGIFKKLSYWYAVVFAALWLLGVVIIAFFSIVLTCLFIFAK